MRLRSLECHTLGKGILRYSKYNICFYDAETQLERDMENYVKKEMRKYHRSSESFRDRCVIEKLCAENR
jgi:hypothetical protein